MEDWRDMQKAALWHHVPASMECLDDVYSRGVNVTTHYSGTGAAEMAVAKVLRGSVHFHGACDFSPTCQHVLLNHGPECAAEHVTQDLLARPPKDVVDELQALLKTHQEQAEAEVGASTPGEKHNVMRAVGLKWVDAAMRVLARWTPKREDTAYCLRHGRGCPAFPPRASASTPGRLHLEIDGINCQPWTYGGKRMGWLDERSIPCLILFQSILSVQPDAVCLECTPGFDFPTARRLLRGFRGDYAITTPLDFGRPVGRKRMYMWFDRMLSLRAVHREVSTILDVSRRSLLVGPEIFLQASRAEVQRLYYGMAQKASKKDGGPSHPSVLRRLTKKQPPPCKLRVRDVLPSGLRARYEAHREKVSNFRTLRESCFVRDINTTAGYGGLPQCQSVPTILRSSTLVAMFESEDDDRLLLPSELPGIHGISLPHHVLAKLEPKEVRSLTGNSMHVVQIGTFIQYALATREYYHEHVSGGYCTSWVADTSSGTAPSGAVTSSGTSTSAHSAGPPCMRRSSSSELD